MNTSVQQSSLDKIITLLQHVECRPGMYMGDDSPETFIVFLSGLKSGCKIFGIELGNANDDIYEEIVRARGWNLDLSTYAPRQQMQDRSMTDKEILGELIQIEIEVLLRRYSNR